MNVYLAEFIGTAILILLGNGVVANVVLKDTKSFAAGWMVIATAWAFAVYVAVLVVGPISGAHINPAVTLALAVKGAFAWDQVVPYIVAQFLGGMFGALLVYIFFKDHFAITDEAGAKRACFCTEPAIRKYSSNFICEVIGTFLLVFVIFYIAGADIVLPGASETTPIGLGSIGALPVAILVWAIGLSLGGTTGYAINPARDGGPRIMLTLLAKKLKTAPDWTYGLIPLTAPLVGGVLAALVYKAIM